MLLLQVANINLRLLFLKIFFFNHMIWMIKSKQVFFWTSNLKGYCFHGDKATILYLTLKYYSLSVLSEKLYFLEIGPVNQKLWPFKCMMLKTLNSNFLDWEDILSFYWWTNTMLPTFRRYLLLSCCYVTETFIQEKYEGCKVCSISEGPPTFLRDAFLG